MQDLASTQARADALHAPTRHFPIQLVVGLLFLAGIWLTLCKELSGEWLVNEQYNYGWFVPFFALCLFWLRWQGRPQTKIPNSNYQAPSALGAVAIGTIALLVLLPVRLLEIANPEWRLLDWLHAASVVTLTLLVIWYAGGAAWVRHFAFPVAFIFVAVPWPTGLETPIIQGLMRVVAGVAAETAMLVGIPAQVEGNLIRVTTGLIGVNEACSGIRSLQTSLMIGLLFGELKRLSVFRRVALVAGAVAIAVFANFVRAVFLVAIAGTKNISEVARWHDIAGYTIIALVFMGTLGLAYLLGKHETSKSDARSPTSLAAIRSPQYPIRSSYLAAALCWLFFVEIGTAAWYRVHETNLVSGAHWTVKWPDQAANFRTLRIDPEIRGVLRYDEAQAGAWRIISKAEVADQSTPRSIFCYLYVFRWKAGRNSALLANLHRPDVCLPASGWTQIADDGVKNYPVNDSFELPFRHFEFQRGFAESSPQTAHAFYCLSEDRRSGDSTQSKAGLPSMSGNRSEWTRTERLGAVLQGRRHLGQQVIEAIFTSNEPFSAADAESHLRQLIRDVVRLREAD